ncbi:uncharacterized protein O3C94_002679 [Discoglossus pictus]
MDRANSLRTDMNHRGKILPLDRQEAKKVLEIYVKRSLSSCDKKTEKYQLLEKRRKKVQRSASDFHKSTGCQFTDRVKVIKRTEVNNTQEVEKHELVGDKMASDISEDTTDMHLPACTDNAKGLQTMKKPSWFKNFLGLLFKKKEDKKEEKSMKCAEGNVPLTSCVTQEPSISSNDGFCRQNFKKRSSRKASIRKAFSFKKNATEESKGGREEVDSGCSNKLKRPTALPLTNICKPSSRKGSKKEKDNYYNKVSVEIEHIVKESDDPSANSRKPSLGGELNLEETEDHDVLIKKIVSILQKQGDMWDRKIKENPTVSTFFRDISYNSFKQLADVYVEKEVKYNVADVTPEDITFAYSVHFTAQVAGISSHPVNRIMGFGNQYLQDKFTHFSYNRRAWSNNETLSDEALSPD